MMKTKTHSRLITVLVVVLCLAALTAGWLCFDTFVDRSGWREKDGQHYYRDFHGKKVTGWLQNEYGKYYLGDDSYMVTGWQTIDGQTYWFGQDGTAVTGWQEIDGSRYYFDGQGRQQRGWFPEGGSRYYLTPAMVTGWAEVDGARRYFDETGALASGWLTQEDGAYYLDGDGVPVTGIQTIEEKNYYFDETGLRFRGWIDLDAGRYYFGDDGVMVTGWQTVNGKTFHFGDDGVETVGWLDDGEYRYYLTLNDGTVSGEQMLEGKPYYFTPDGIYVLLVNDENPIPKSYEPELVDLDGKFQVAAVCVEALRKMLADCLAAGDVYSINNTYRSYEEQQKVLSDRIQRYMDEDPKLSEADATEKARREVTRPGTSEHQTGLGMDINGDGVECCEWLKEHCWEYGFILRFPEGKEDITGIVYEPWHFRYVGTRVSIPMRDAGVCLEEYLGAA